MRNHRVIQILFFVISHFMGCEQSQTVHHDEPIKNTSLLIIDNEIGFDQVSRYITKEEYEEAK